MSIQRSSWSFDLVECCKLEVGFYYYFTLSLRWAIHRKYVSQEQQLNREEDEDVNRNDFNLYVNVSLDVTRLMNYWDPVYSKLFIIYHTDSSLFFYT